MDHVKALADALREIDKSLTGDFDYENAVIRLKGEKTEAQIIRAALAARGKVE